MKTINRIFVIFLLIGLCVGCEKEIIPLDGDQSYQTSGQELSGLKAAQNQNAAKVTGTVEVLWKGATKGSDMGNKPENLLAFLDLSALEGTTIKAPRGEVIYTVLKTDFTLHREIRAEVFDVFINPLTSQGWVLARVVADSKGCDGNGGSGHDSGCSSGSHDDGCGGTDDDASHDGGCSHDDPDGGGCSHDDPDGGGCTHDDPDGGGCSGGGSPDSGGGPGTPGGGDKGNPLSGKNCRIGQILALKAKDTSTPGKIGDCITWKWFGPDAVFGNPEYNPESWPHLCKKEIIGGNVTVHF